ncbi:unnamed protein product [Rotaria sp. Silwood1]|nr:unnamed protein product [Rotaria sp. Silwood1]
MNDIDFRTLTYLEQQLKQQYPDIRVRQAIASTFAKDEMNALWHDENNDGKQYKCWSSSFNWDFKLMHIYKRVLSFFNHRHDQHKQIII